ncbi:MAG TPA: class IV adenylate cyclase [Candidatus Polarisedimenticolaceae bacterium]
MGRNVEIKARLHDRVTIERRVRELAGPAVRTMAQEDTFFACPGARLKLRVIDGVEGELIVYRRPDATGPKASDYAIYRTSAPSSLKTVMEAACGTIGVVRKLRTLYLDGAMRIHLDAVEGRGDFLELEYVLRDDESAGEGTTAVHSYREALGIPEGDLVAGAYLDLKEAP